MRDKKLQKSSILSALAYFDIFNHPLTVKEIHRFIDQESTLDEVESLLHILVDTGEVSYHNPYYGIANLRANIEERIEKQKRAEKIIPIAKRNARIIARFPFNRCVCISGSLSKGVLEKGGDIDYFIITKPGRIWISKFLLKLYKYVFLKNSKDYFCINYIITEDTMEIKEKNLFTATELETLLLMANPDVYKSFMEANNWYNELLPNGNRKDYDRYLVESDNPYFWSKIIQVLLNNGFGTRVDRWLQKIAKQRNQKKYAEYAKSKDYTLMIRSESGEAKIHPPNAQGRVLKLHHEKLTALQS